jgi:3-keto-L-gulonate-6-phosphate decarboxylase
MSELNTFKEAARATQKTKEAAEKLQKDIIADNSKDKAPQSMDEMSRELVAWQKRYNEVALVNNRHVEIITQLMNFLSMQCGILYTAITGALPENPLQEISALEIVNFDASQEDLQYFRKGLIIYLKKLQENGNVEEAYQGWLKYINS